MIKGNAIITILSLSMLLTITSACSNKDSKDQAEITNETQLEEEPEIIEVENKIVYPLTGLEAEEESKLNQRPIAVMINNHPKARPQSGLHKADIVYEVLAEGMITRFLAIYQSEIPSVIGPVRSARDYYIELSNGYNALYISHGWSPIAKEMLESGSIDHLNGLFYDGTLFKRASHRKAPHNSYISKENIFKGARENNYDLEDKVDSLSFLTETDIETVGGEPATRAVIRYDDKKTWHVVYEYNATDNNYTRYSGDEQAVDYESNEPILVNNILIVEMEHYFIDEYGRRGIDLRSGGKAILLHNGVKREIEWQNQNGRIVPISEGEVVKLIPGKTWINIVPIIDETLSIQS